MTSAQWSLLLGGLGLLLLGMRQLTSGLRQAAGRALHRLLALWTCTRPRGLLTGVLLTAVVQSSSAVTVATISFANAGLLTLGQAAWVVFGSNIGTTMTSWLVALIGLRMDVEVLALPLIGMGAVLWLLRGNKRSGALGEAAAGFGMLFLGIDFLRDALEGGWQRIPLEFLEGPGYLRMLLAVGVGVLITTLVQSSSAALAILLAAASRGLFSLHVGAALVVGANLGTTSTALLASLGAAPAARRVAMLHVAFNLLTALAAFFALDPLLLWIGWLRERLGLEPQAATELALFHTLFNVLGVLLMVPLSGRLVRWLEGHFVSQEEDLARPRHIDRTTLQVPHVALEALRLESARAAGIAAAMVRDSLLDRPAEIATRRDALRRLLVAMGEHAREMARGVLPEEVARRLPQLLRAQARLAALSTLVEEVEETREELAALDAKRAPWLDPAFLAPALEALARAGADGPIDLPAVAAAREALEAARDPERERILRAALSGELPIEATGLLFQLYQLVRRIVSQVWKAVASIEGGQRELSPPVTPSPSADPQADAPPGAPKSAAPPGA